MRGAQGSEQDLADLYRLVRRYAEFSEKLVLSLFPEYGPHMTRAGTSLRPSEIAGRPVSWRKDDTRLHVDSFPSNPLLGQRLLRVFHNIDPAAARVWRVGEPFADFAQRFVPKTHGMWPGQAGLMKLLHITKRKRSEYDHRMLQLHDLAKRPGLPGQRAAAGIPLSARIDVDCLQRPVAARRHARPRNDGADHLPGPEGDLRPHPFTGSRALAHAGPADAGFLTFRAFRAVNALPAGLHFPRRQRLHWFSGLPSSGAGRGRSPAAISGLAGRLMETTYDYVVVGAGSAGCALAGRWLTAVATVSR